MSTPIVPIDHVALGLSRVALQYQNSADFLAYLAARGVDNDTLRRLCIDNPARLLTA